MRCAVCTSANQSKAMIELVKHFEFEKHADSRGVHQKRGSWQNHDKLCKIYWACPNLGTTWAVCCSATRGAGLEDNLGTEFNSDIGKAKRGKASVATFTLAVTQADLRACTMEFWMWYTSFFRVNLRSVMPSRHSPDNSKEQSSPI